MAAKEKTVINSEVPLNLPRFSKYIFHLGRNSGRHVFYLKAEQILNLGGNKQNADTGRKTDNHQDKECT